MDIQAEKIELVKRLLDTDDESVLQEVKAFSNRMRRISGMICLNMLKRV